MPDAPCTDPHLKMWNAVPDGARLQISVVGHTDPEDDQFVAEVVFRPTVDDGETWQDADVRPGPKESVLSSPQGYTATVFVTFAAQDTAQIRARIVKPDGSVHGKAYCHAVGGAPGEQHVATIMVFTKKS